MQYTHMPLVSSYNIDNSPAQVHEPAGHFEYEMILVIQGEVAATIAHRTYRLRRGSLVFVGRLESHSFLIQKTPYVRYLSTFSSDRLLENIRENQLLAIFLCRPDTFRHVIQLDEETLGRVTPIFEQFTWESGSEEPFSLSKCASLLNLLLIELYRYDADAFPAWSNSNAQTAVVAAQRYMVQNFCRPLTLEEVAAHTYVSPHTLSVAFGQMLGLSFKNYLILLRIAESKRLLLSTDLPIADIAGRVGYSNVNNFIKMFRSRVGTTPLQYRRRVAATLPE